MENSKLSDVKGKELVAAGHAFAKAIGMDTPLIEIAKMVSVLATRLDCALVRGDACMQAEMVWEKAMMAAIGEDGVGCVVRAIAELKAERDALAAENVALKNFAWSEVVAADQEKEDRWMTECTGARDRFISMQTPATVAYLNFVRAEGVDYVAEAIGAKCAELKIGSKDWKALKSIVFMLGDFSSKLRAGDPS
ncbi:hypothetical protein [Pantoea agglomerans]|uniref:hypothetical protein n=1 Tax=Enterobacter agglomerans TaxID=549 RepID=UPI001FD660FC|nr:hypothetical protein [Pantoea agglomerans]UOV19262.1 hypothetical protein LZ609_04595 [Pantoea agglomerans]